MYKLLEGSCLTRESHRSRIQHPKYKAILSSMLYRRTIDRDKPSAAHPYLIYMKIIREIQPMVSLTYSDPAGSPPFAFDHQHFARHPGRPVQCSWPYSQALLSRPTQSVRSHSWRLPRYCLSRRPYRPVCSLRLRRFCQQCRRGHREARRLMSEVCEPLPES